MPSFSAKGLGVLLILQNWGSLVRMRSDSRSGPTGFAEASHTVMKRAQATNSLLSHTTFSPYTNLRSAASTWSYITSGSYTTTSLPLVEKVNGTHNSLFNHSLSASRFSRGT